MGSEKIIEKARLEAEVRAKDERINREKAVSDARKEMVRQFKPEGVFKEQIENIGLKKELLSEIRTNLKIATTPWTGKPLRFETTKMDNNKGEFDSLISDYRADIREAYTDMAMANNIVWLVTDLGAGSKDLEDSYVKLCVKISERLSKLLQALSS